MDMVDFTGIFAGLNTAQTTLKNLIGVVTKGETLKQVTEARAEVFKALETASAIQTRYLAQKEELRETIERLHEVENIRLQAENYVLTDLGSGAFVYALKAGVEPPQTPHWLCVPCLDRRKKSILQYVGRVVTPLNKRGDYSQHTCPACKASVIAFYARAPGREKEPGKTTT